MQVTSKPKLTETADIAEARPTRTVLGWQGVGFDLPPDWNVTGFSMDYDNGYLRVDAPGNGTITVQVRWTNAAKPKQSGPPNMYSFLAPRFRKWFKRPDPPVQKPDLQSSLEKMLKETAKQAKKAKTNFDSNLKPEKIEGENAERTAINFTWTGEGKGQGKIWHCAACNRVVIAQVVGMAKDSAAIGVIASQLFATFHDHSDTGFDRWALYDLQVDIPSDFRIEAQKLLSGYLSLTWARGAERIILDRWGLANMTRKKFTLAEWFRNNAAVNLRRLPETEIESQGGHAITRYAGALPLAARLRALREGRLSLRRFPSRYEGGVWECEETNKIYILQTLTNRSTEGLWEQVEARCVCH